jgi:prepilin signal peptidase PulO-like enzyme (type II secretory pathway)
MEILFIILVFIFGIIIGSFLNVVILRFNTGVNIGGRSKCMTCGKTLVWYELIPIVSFLIQGGSCRKCKAKISRQYPLVEAFTGFLFALVFLQFYPYTTIGIVILIIHLIIASLLVVISAYDIKHKIIPNGFVYTFAGLAFISIFLSEFSWFVVPSLLQIFAGPLLALPFALLWLVSKGTWMGLGDAKLLLGIGWLLGLNASINSVMLAFWIAAVISITWLLVTYHSIKPRTEIPFGPYLILGMYIVLLFGVRIVDFAISYELFSSFF